MCDTWPIANGKLDNYLKNAPTDCHNSLVIIHVILYNAKYLDNSKNILVRPGCVELFYDKYEFRDCI